MGTGRTPMSLDDRREYAEKLRRQADVLCQEADWLVYSNNSADQERAEKLRRWATDLENRANDIFQINGNEVEREPD